jgi:putative DNA primase/helicase
MSHDYDDDDPAPEQLPSGFLKLDEIKGETQTKWLWPGKVPLGHVTIVAGEASSGKSLLAAEIAARVSSGAGWPRNGMQSVPHRDNAGETPGAETTTGSVLIAHANLHENLVLKGRLLAAGAEASRVAVINRDAFHFERDIGAGEKGYHEPTAAEMSLSVLEGALIQIPDASLLVIDHLLGWLGVARLRPDQLAEVFKRLADMAARYRVAVVVLWRLEKGGRAAQTRALDALAGAAPVVWLVANDTYNPQSRFAVCAQNRLGAPSDELSFRVAGDRLLWQPVVRHVSADDVLAARTADRHERRQAGQWLLDLLSQGPIEAKLLWQEARECGLAERTVRRAAAELDLHPTKDGKRNVWLWGTCVPALEAVPPDAVMQNVAALPAAGSLAAVVQVELRPDAPPSVAVLPVVGSLAQANGAVEDVSAGEQSVAVLPPVGSLPGSAVVQVELRSDAPPSVAVLPVVGSARANGAVEDISAGEQNVAVLPAVGSLANAKQAVEAMPASEPNVKELIFSDERSEQQAELTRLTEVLAAGTSTEGGGDRAEQAESPSARKRRLRREQRFIEQTLRICRDG